MKFYPQLNSGATVQFPFRTSYRRRTIVNELPDGGQIRFEDAGAQSALWRIEYRDLNTAEWEAIRDLHEEMAGRLGTFTFFDPNRNLLAWSEEFERPVWEKDVFLSVTPEIPDPNGGMNGRLLNNSSAVDRSVTQRVTIPTSYVTAFSVWLRADAEQTAGLIRGGEVKDVLVTPRWQRVAFSGQGSGGGDETAFGIRVPSGSTIAAFGAQVEAQPVPSSYKRSEGATGVHRKTRFGSDRLEFWSEGPGRYRAVVLLESVTEAA